MNLVVYSHWNISHTLETVNHLFSDIPPKRIVEPLKPSTVTPFHNHMGRIVVYRLQTSGNMMNIYWQTPNLKEYLEAELIQHFLLYRERGSISHYLTKYGLATTVTCELLRCTSFYLFNVGISLTKLGWDKMSLVIKTVYEFIMVLRMMSQSDYILHWKALGDILQVHFDYNLNQDITEYIRYTFFNRPSGLFKE